MTKESHLLPITRNLNWISISAKDTEEVIKLKPPYSVYCGAASIIEMSSKVLKVI